MQREGLIQDTIIAKLNQFALKNNFKQVNAEGICNALTFLYILAKQDGFSSEYLAELYRIGEMEDLPAASAIPKEPNKDWLLFTKYINLAIFIQNMTDKYLPAGLPLEKKGEYILNMLSTNVQAAFLPEGTIRYKEGSVPIQSEHIHKINLRKEELMALLKSIVMPGRQVKINSKNYENVNHTLEVEFDGNQYIFFDSNYPDFLMQTPDISVLANAIIQGAFLNASSVGDFFPFEIVMFSRQAIPAFDYAGFVGTIMQQRKMDGLQNCEVYDGTTQLFNAIDKNDMEAIRRIIESGADTIGYKIQHSYRSLRNEKSEPMKVHLTTGYNALSYALSVSKVAIANLLVSYLKMDDPALAAKDKNGNTVLMNAIRLRDWDLVKQILDKISDHHSLLNEESDNAQSPLLLAIAARNLELVQLLLAKGADPNQIAYQDAGVVMTPLLSAIQLNDRADNPAWQYKEAAKSIELVDALIRGGANINDSRNNLPHPLRFAFDAGNAQAAKRILDHPRYNMYLSGINDLNAEMKKAYERGNFRLILLLVERNTTPLHYPIDGKYLENLLYGQGQEINDKMSERHQIVNLLFTTADMSAQDSKGNSALHYALRSMVDLELVSALLKNNPGIVNYANNQAQGSGPPARQENTALTIVFNRILAATYEGFDKPQFDYYTQALKLLFEYAPDPDLVNVCFDYLTENCMHARDYDHDKLQQIAGIFEKYFEMQERKSDGKRHAKKPLSEDEQRWAHNELLKKKDYILHHKWSYSIFRGNTIEGRDSKDRVVTNSVTKSVKDWMFPTLSSVRREFDPKVNYLKIIENYRAAAQRAADKSSSTRKGETSDIYKQESQIAVRPDYSDHNKSKDAERKTTTHRK